MALDRFTTLAQEALANAQSGALGSEHAQITPLHLLSSLLDGRDAIAGSILERAGVDRHRVLEVARPCLSPCLCHLPSLLGKPCPEGAPPSPPPGSTRTCSSASPPAAAWPP